MNWNNANRRRGRRGLGLVEMAVILAGVALVLYVAVGQLGQIGSSSISQTAGGIADPQKIFQHPMLAGNPGNADDDDGDDGGKDKASKGKKVGIVKGNASASALK